MAFPQFTCRAFIVAYLAFSSAFATSTLAFRSVPSLSNDRVSLALYYESLCPYSANFIINYLAKAFDNGIIDIVDLKLVPWGNAKIRGNSTFDCQHGPAECFLNTVEACAINVWPELSKHFAFIDCVETFVYNRNFTQWEKCFEKLNLDAVAIADCYSNGQGKELELEYADETSSLEPPHEYVPWVVVDGKPLYEEYEDFISYVCKAYKGETVPTACASELGIIKTDDTFLSRIGHKGKTWISWVLEALNV